MSGVWELVEIKTGTVAEADSGPCEACGTDTVSVAALHGRKWSRICDRCLGAMKALFGVPRDVN